jgi:hypothetical protein
MYVQNTTALLVHVPAGLSGCRAVGLSGRRGWVLPALAHNSRVGTQARQHAVTPFSKSDDEFLLFWNMTTQIGSTLTGGQCTTE